MSSELVFQPNDRVWVFANDAWWPAKVIDAEQAMLMSGSEVPPGIDYVVLYYGESSLGFVTAAELEAFEDSSGKAVTTDPALKKAIKLAAEDTTANPLRVVAQSSTKRPADRTDRGGGATNGAIAAKKARKEMPTNGNHVAKAEDGDDGDCYPRGAQGYRYESVQFLMDVEKRLRAAIDAADVNAARKQLLKLDHVKITREQLAATKIGVAIGDVLGHSGLAKLWPLAQALVNWFILALPRQTIQAIQHFHEVHSATEVELSVAKEAVAAATVGSSFLNRSSTSVRTLDKVIAVFRADQEASGATMPANFNLSSFVEAFFADIRDADHKRLFLSFLTKPGLFKLRQQILDGTLTGEAFSRLSMSDFVTDDEKNAEEAKIRAIIAAQEAEDKINSVGTTMFECPNCHKKNATYHEQQTRGADEPTTKFVKCIECKHNWTTE
jgi:transcription elongation factor S-II